MRVSRYWSVVDAIGNLSYDPKRKVGALIVDINEDILSSGFNGFPRGVVDDPDVLADKEAKLKLVVHAEQNAIYNAARVGIRLKGSSMLCNLFPCVDCSKAIIQAGIKTLYTIDPRQLPETSKWREGAKASIELLGKAGVIVYLKGE